MAEQRQATPAPVFIIIMRMFSSILVSVSLSTIMCMALFRAFVSFFTTCIMTSFSSTFITTSMLS